MINALLDPNQIPLVRAIERRTGETAQRPFEPGLSSVSPGSNRNVLIELEAGDAHGKPHDVAFDWAPGKGVEVPSPAASWALSTQTFLLTQPVSLPVAAAPAAPVAPRPVGVSSPSPGAPTPAVPSAAEAGAPWQQRWLQWLQGQGADVQLRLRDYRLQESDYPRLIEQLHHFTREQGLTLTRLMVNGRELWRLPASETGVSHGR